MSAPGDDPSSDAQLAQRILAGDAGALRVLLERHAGIIAFIGERFGYSEDLTSDVFVHLLGPRGDWAKLRQWTGAGSLRAFLKRVAQRLCLTDFRKNKKRREKLERLPEEGEVPESKEPTPLDELVSRISAEELLSIVQSLGEPHRCILLQHYFRTPPATAEEMNMTEGALRVALHRARKKLEEVLRQKGWDGHD